MVWQKDSRLAKEWLFNMYPMNNLGKNSIRRTINISTFSTIFTKVDKSLTRRSKLLKKMSFEDGLISVSSTTP